MPTPDFVLPPSIEKRCNQTGAACVCFCLSGYSRLGQCQRGLQSRLAIVFCGLEKLRICRREAPHLWVRTHPLFRVTVMYEQLTPARILTTAFVIVIPVAIHLLCLVRLPSLLERKTAALLGQSVVFGERHAVSLPYDIGDLPTRGRATSIATVIILNISLLLTDYRIADPNVFDRLPAHVANRAGTPSLISPS